VVDLAFVGLFVAALFALTPPLALVTVLAMPPFVLLSALAHRGRRRRSRPASAPTPARPRA
jgi:ABC-type bacteriocin/lantibiotic exporter with double-glycine peptidase domain